MRKPCFEIRPSPIQGRGVFATRRIRKGTRIIEYTGEQLTPSAADARYDDDRREQPHVLLFTVDRWTVIDAGVGGNEARYFNHSCEPNCEAVTEQRRVYLEALRTIEAGEELSYDYQLERGGWHTVEWGETVCLPVWGRNLSRDDAGATTEANAGQRTKGGPETRGGLTPRGSGRAVLRSARN